MTYSSLNFDAGRLAEWSQGEWSQPVEQSISSIVHDSRTVKEGSLFLAIRGEHHDGHSFIPAVAAKGAVGAVVDQFYVAPADLTLPLLRVRHTEVALKEMARAYRQAVGSLIVGITGSAGKTTVKDMIADVLSTQGRTSRTPGNWNNEIGLPLSILSMQPRSEFGVFELGTNHPGEIAELSDILRPICGVLTNVGSAHIGNFGSIDAIAEEKVALLRALPEEGVAILNRDESRFDWFCAQTRARVVSVSISGNADYVLQDRAGENEVEVYEPASGMGYSLTLPLPGEHVKRNALCAIAVGREFGLAPDKIVEALENFEPGHMRWQKTQAGGFKIVNDAYNANPESMSAAIDAFARTTGEGSRWLVLGGMRELGEFEVDAHREIGARATRSGEFKVLFVGELAPLLAAGAEADTFTICKDIAAVVAHLRAHGQPGDTLLLKGSRTEHLERIIDLLR